MKVSYDKKHDIAYIRFSNRKPDGAIEIDEGVVLDTTTDNKIVGMEIFDASQRIPLRNLFSVEAVRWLAQADIWVGWPTSVNLPGDLLKGSP